MTWIRSIKQPAKLDEKKQDLKTDKEIVLNGVTFVNKEAEAAKVTDENIIPMPGNEISDQPAETPDIPYADNEITIDFEKALDHATDFAHKIMMRVGVMPIENAFKIDIEQMKMQQLMAMRFKRIG